MSLITLFITPKDFNRPHIANIQWNAIKSWTELGAEAEVILIGDDAGVAEIAHELGVKHFPQVRRNTSGTPILRDIFRIACENSTSPLLAYVNADIILFPDFLETAKKIRTQTDKFLLVGQRWDLDVQERINFNYGWQKELQANLSAHGRRHPAGGSDYFIYPRTIFTDIPDFAIGRSGWDNWMFFEARFKNWSLINCSNAINIIHQDHDYAHLPDGKSHYRLPESDENVKLAGGKRTIFTLLDCNYEITCSGTLRRPKMNREKFLREAEIFPLVTLKSKSLGDVAFSAFHPKKAYAEWRKKK